MPILIDRNTNVICQGITGKTGGFHARSCISGGTRIVAGVTPGRGGHRFDGEVPVYDTVAEAVARHHVDATMIFVPAPGAANAIGEAALAGVGLIICITEGIPQSDMLTIRALVYKCGVKLVGPNSPGIIVPGQCKIGIMPHAIHSPGSVGVISRSGTLMYEAVAQLTRLGLGQSTCIGIGGDPIHGLGFVELLAMFEEDGQTDAVLLIGEIGGNEEERAAEWIRQHGTKPVVAFVAGACAPPGRRMGHAGAIISGSAETYSTKVQVLGEAGVTVCKDPSRIGKTVAEVLGGRTAR